MSPALALQFHTFGNEEGHRRTIRIDSKLLAALQSDGEESKDEKIAEMRRIIDTVGKSGMPGEHVRCVVSVSMLTEGWDANTVTHILGIRAFGTQLLCEQVVGRGLRRMSYAVNDEGLFNPEYAEVYGVPFSFIPTSGSGTEVTPGPTPTRVRALEDRIACEITFPRLIGYRYEIPTGRLRATFSDESKLALSTADVPTSVENRPIVGETSIHTLDDLKKRLRERNRLPPGEADAREVLPPGRREAGGPPDRAPLRCRRAELAVPAGARHRQALDGRVPHVQGRHLSAAPAPRGARTRRR